MRSILKSLKAKTLTFMSLKVEHFRDARVRHSLFFSLDLLLIIKMVPKDYLQIRRCAALTLVKVA